MPVILDHTIVGQSATSLTIRKDRMFAGCRLCGAVFQSELAVRTANEEYNLTVQFRVRIETEEWRRRHNATHTPREHVSFRKRGLTMTPEAAIRMAPFGLVPVDDAMNDAEVAQALLEAPRAPVDDVEMLAKGVR